MNDESKKIGLRLEVTTDERDDIRKAAALAGYRSMAEFCRVAVLEATQQELTRAGIQQAQQQ